MTKTKVFRSGNSVAVRLPKSLGVKAGTELRVREEQGRYILEPVQSTIDVSGFAGKAAWLKPLKPEDRQFEERKLDWEGKRLKRG
jgi:antitoxin VapB